MSVHTSSIYLRQSALLPCLPDGAPSPRKRLLARPDRVLFFVIDDHCINNGIVFLVAGYQVSSEQNSSAECRGISDQPKQSRTSPGKRRQTHGLFQRLVSNRQAWRRWNVLRQKHSSTLFRRFHDRRLFVRTTGRSRWRFGKRLRGSPDRRLAALEPQHAIAEMKIPLVVREHYDELTLGAH